jgi:oxygen-independent coproporphyrinogen III oxidase
MEDRDNPALGLYISIPFCRSKCTYCNFSSGVYPASEHARYVDRLIQDLRNAGTLAERTGANLPRRVDTAYLGGGTPSLLAPELLHRLFAAIRSEFVLDSDAEITMECAPGQLPDATLDAMVSCGVNRVSLGVQSFIDREAHESGRLHNRATIESDLHRLRTAGITNINIDLIAGLAGQTFASWNESLSALIDSGTPHASVYMLEIDEDSRLGRELLAGGVRYRASLVPHEDAIARMYELAIERLAEAGLMQYEISNFAREGCESRHNLRYWRRQPYVGLGLDASSMLRASTEIIRWTVTDDLRTYLDGAQTTQLDCLSLDQQHEEAWFLGLRLNAGVDLAALENEFGSSRVGIALDIAKRLASDGMLIISDGHARLTERGRMLSNDIFQEFLADPEDTDSCGQEQVQPVIAR